MHSPTTTLLSLTSFLLALTFSPQVHAHFGLEYPQWRMDTLASGLPSTISQWNYPCAGVLSNMTGVNRTDWPIDGGSLKLDLHHPWTYVFVTLGLQLTEGATVSTFNISLTGPTFLNTTGNGTLCISKLSLPKSVSVVDGQKASIQVVTTGASGSALYNCADITFRANATLLPANECVTNGVTSYAVQAGPAGSSSDTCASTTTGTGTSSTGSSSPSPTRVGSSAATPGRGVVNAAMLGFVVGMAGLFLALL